MQACDIPSEQLSSMLPNDLIMQALQCQDLDGDCPDAALAFMTLGVRSPPQVIKSNLVPSPQVAPLESRIHSYTLTRHKHQSYEALPVSLTSLFRQINFQEEVSTVVQAMNSRLALFPELRKLGVFAEAVQSIKEFKEKARKPLLRAEALTFQPSSFDKENRQP